MQVSKVPKKPFLTLSLLIAIANCGCLGISSQGADQCQQRIRNALVATRRLSLQELLRARDSGNARKTPGSDLDGLARDSLGFDVNGPIEVNGSMAELLIRLIEFRFVEHNLDSADVRMRGMQVANEVIVVRQVQNLQAKIDNVLRCLGIPMVGPRFRRDMDDRVGYIDNWIAVVVSSGAEIDYYNRLFSILSELSDTGECSIQCGVVWTPRPSDLDGCIDRVNAQLDGCSNIESFRSMSQARRLIIYTQSNGCVKDILCAVGSCIGADLVLIPPA